MSYYTKMETKCIFIYIYLYIFILEFKIGFSSEVSLMYIGLGGGFKREARGKKMREITLTEVP